MYINQLQKYTDNLDENYESIRKLCFLGWNIWKVYRNYFVGKTKSKTTKRSIHTNKNILTLFRKYRISNSIVLRVTSAVHNTFVDGKYYSKRIDVLKNSIEAKYNCKTVGFVYIEKKNKIVPDIEIELDSCINYYSRKLYPFLFVYTLFNSFAHNKILKNIEKIRFRTIWKLQSGFLSKYLLYKLFYFFNKPSKVLFTFASYGCEAEIAALKSLGITILEYQHGHIYYEHFGYNYHKALKPLKDKMLFPDSLFVYGNYWKDVLLKHGFFDSTEVSVCGNPSFENVKTISIQSKGKKPILVCSQPNLAPLFMKFIDNYTKNSKYKDKYYWIIKLHPREVVGEWSNFIQNRQNIELSNIDTFELLNSIDIQLTGSSTTLYEALHFGVSNYIIFNELKLNESDFFNNSIGKTIDVNWVEEFIKLDCVNSDQYFQKYKLNI